MSDEAEDAEPVPTTPEATIPTPPPENTPINEPMKSKNENPSTNSPSNHETVGISEGIGKRPKGPDEVKGKKLQPCPPPQSRCKVRSRDTRQCKKHFREMIGKSVIRNDELEQRETDLRQRLEMLECSMPAVMVWNIWRQAQGAPVSHLREIVEKQLLEPATSCPSTPSQHWDCRVREVEAERKQALHRAEEAREVFAVKGDALKVQKQQIEEARRLQEERKAEIAKLEEEVKRLQDALKKAQGDESFCETGECGEIQCRKIWLQGVSSASSIHSTDLECLAKLQDLAEAELCMKRQIADLERRECAYMRTLQQADEMWAKMEDDNASNLGDLKDQLDAKIAANQQLADRIVELEDDVEKLRAQLTRALAALDKRKGRTFSDVGFGDGNISTEEKLEQTEEVVKDCSEDCEAGGVTVVEEMKQPKSGILETEEIQPPKRKEETELKPKTEDKTPIAEEVSKEGAAEGQSNHELIQATTEISTTEESVQVKPEIGDAETQSIAEETDPEKEAATEKLIQVESTIKDVVPETGGEMSTEHLPEQQQEATVPEEKQVDKPLSGANDPRLFEDKASLAHPLKAPTENKDKISVAAVINESSVKQEEAFQLTPEVTNKTAAGPLDAKTSEATRDATPEIADEVVPEAIPEPVVEVSFGAAAEPVAEAQEVASSGPLVETVSESVVEADAIIQSPEIAEEAVPQPVSEIKPVVDPASGVEVTSVPVDEPEPKSVIDADPILSPKPVLETLEIPALEPTPVAIEPEQIKLTANTLAVPIQTLLSWHNVTACLRKQISTCPRCSSTYGEIGRMLEEIRTYLGKDAPESAEIECPEVKEEVQNSVPIPTRKGPCICKPKSCPLDGTPAAAPAQADARIQTVVDGQSQTSMPVKVSHRESRSSKSSGKGSTKSKEEVKLTSIEEGTEPDPGMRRVKSIPEARDESTVTVGDIASQTEAVRKVSSVNKDEEKPCVCPTGVCPKKNAHPSPRGECSTSGKISAGTKKALGKEYKSTADAILVSAITVRPSNERPFGPPIEGARADDTSSESSSFACCMCGKALTPVASRKTTSIPVPTKSVFKSKLTTAVGNSEDDFLCCSCKTKESPSSKLKSSASKSSGKCPDIGRLSKRMKPTSGTMKTSCNREVCCPCSDKEEVHVLTETLTTDLEISKSKTRPETKDVCCLAKISRDKVSKTEARRRKDKDSSKTATPSVSHTGSERLPSSSSAYKGSRTDDSDSNVCCSSIEQVVDMTRKKGKGRKCVCDSKNSSKEQCVCGEFSEPSLPEREKHIEPSASCLCPSKLFDEF